MNKNSIRLSDGPDLTFNLLDYSLAEIDRVATFYRLDTYPHQIEVITSEQMMDGYSSVGMTINYPTSRSAKSLSKPNGSISVVSKGWSIEIDINSNPFIAYLMEENTITMQALVMAHTCYRHN